MDNNSNTNQNANDFNNVENRETLQSKKNPNFGSRLSSGLKEINGLRNDYKQAGSLAGLAKNVAKDKINDKVNEKVDTAKQNIKNKASSMIPDSIKQKQQALKNKQQVLNEKLHVPQKKLQEGKAKLNEKTFKKGVKTAVNSIAPGAGEAAEKILETSKGEPALEAARAASNPLSALKEGGKKLAEIIISTNLKKNLILYLGPIIVVILMIVILIITVTSKFGDSQSYFKGDALGGENSGLSAVEEKYKKFYENVEKHGGTNKAMVIAVLTAYKDNDFYTNENNNESIDSCTQDEIENNECVVEYDSIGIETFSKAKMKKYIKKVANKIEESGGDISEGKYDSPGNTGSKFFQWLYSDFIAEDYYKDYFKNINLESEKAKLKEEIIHFIYLYYEDIKDFSNIGIISNLCPNGITVKGEGTIDLEEYVAGVVAHEAYQDGGIEALKAQAIVARTFALAYTDGCTKSIPNNTNAQTMYSIDYVKSNAPLSLQAANETAGMVLLSDGKYFLSQYDSFCYADSDCPDSRKNADGTYTVTYTKLPSGEKHKITLSDSSQYTRILSGQGHARGMSQLVSYQMSKQGKKYDEILKFFYSDNVETSQMGLGVTDGIQLGTAGIYSTSIFPINTKMENLTLTQGYLYDGGGYHGAIDLFCKTSKANGNVRDFCTKMQIVASHSGTVTYIQNNRNTDYCANPNNANQDKTLKVVSGCGGYGITIKITDTSDPYYGYSFTYWHFDSIDPNIKLGSQIKTGQFLGYMGSTGNSTGWHLHFKIQNSEGKDINQNSNILEFVSKHGLPSDGIRLSNAMPQN